MKDLNIINGVLYKYNGNDSHVVIPDGVTEIGANAFYHCTSLTSIEIPSSVTKIGIAAFQFCKNLKSIEIPNSVTTIYEGAFQGCENLTRIEIPNSVKNIDSGVFSKCKNLNNIVLPNRITRIDGCTFAECDSLSSIEIPSSVSRIDTWAFFKCKNLTNIKIPNSVEYIGEGAFCHILQVKPQYKPNGSLRAFKAFRRGWTCRRFQYAIGKSYHQVGEIECCENGFHACINPLSVFTYYYGNLTELHFAEVELSGEMDWYDDKVAASDIKIVRELSLSELVEIYNSMEKE